jgi:hypothetical protein
MWSDAQIVGLPRNRGASRRAALLGTVKSCFSTACSYRFRHDPLHVRQEGGPAPARSHRQDRSFVSVTTSLVSAGSTTSQR